jgi:hypothetical protein
MIGNPGAGRKPTFRRRDFLGLRQKKQKIFLIFKM